MSKTAEAKQNMSLILNAVQEPDRLVIEIADYVGHSYGYSEDKGYFETDTGKEVREKLKEVAASANTQILVRIISNKGGSVDLALQVVDELRQHPSLKITTMMTGFCASAATVIAQAATKGRRKIAKNAMILIHEVQSVAVGSVTEIKQQVQDLETVNKLLEQIYIDAGGNAKDVAALMADANGQGRWLTPNEALKYGLVDEIVAADLGDVGIMNASGDVPQEAIERLHKEMELNNENMGLLGLMTNSEHERILSEKEAAIAAKYEAEIESRVKAAIDSATAKLTNEAVELVQKEGERLIAERDAKIVELENANLAFTTMLNAAKVPPPQGVTGGTVGFDKEEYIKTHLG